MKELNNKFYMEADITLVDETDAMRHEAASVIKLPEPGDKQPDLSYFTAIFVSSGTNLNSAHFLPTELVKASKSVPSKAVDVEHEEAEIIGHIYDHAFIDTDGTKKSLKELSSMEKASLDKQDIHIVIAGIIYKSRFPEISQEMAEGKWKVSMEAYYQDFDIKIGEMILDKKEAETLGLVSAEQADVFGKAAKVIKKGVEIASGEVARVLRGICFSGVGIVKNPANPPSVVLETANKKGKDVPSDLIEEPIVLNYDTLEDTDNKVTSSNIDVSEEDLEKSDLQYNDTTGICVNYKRRAVNESSVEGPDTEVVNTDWCSLYEQSCSSFSRDTTDPKCLKNQVSQAATACIQKLIKTKEDSDLRNCLVEELNIKIEKAAKIL